MKKIVFLIPIFIFYSCTESLFNSGEIITREIKIQEFHNIEINDIFEAYIYQDTIREIIVKGGSNLIPNLTFHVNQEKTLIIDDSNSARWSRDYDKIELHITVDTLHFLTLNAPAKVECIDTIKTPELKIFSIADYAEISVLVDCNNLYFVNSGTSGGQITLKGSTYSFGFWARASFQLFAEEFISNKITAKNESIGNCSIHATEYLSAEILKTGLIYYQGNPKTIEYINEEAKDKLIKMD
ncbi:MAG TPA: DUF2807 domain-containing protein [Bacteroidales bacterium]|nr:DUF2807 domain-containing protein [Bacteroidales bacterium]